MSTKAERMAEADAARTAAVDTAQQRFRAATEAPLAEYLTATAVPRAELEAAEELARRVWAETIGAIEAGL